MPDIQNFTRRKQGQNWVYEYEVWESRHNGTRLRTRTFRFPQDFDTLSADVQEEILDRIGGALFASEANG